MAAATMMSRMLGLVREMVYARFLGDGIVKGAFDYAFMIPNLFRRLLGEGALTAAFIPLFKRSEAEEGEARMWENANAVISALLIFSLALIGVVMVGLSLVLALGEFEAKTELMLRLTRVMFPYMFFVCLAAVFMGMLNARGFFFIPALGATLLNVVMIATVFLVLPQIKGGLDVKIFAVGFAVLVAGVAQAFFQVPFLYRNGYRWRWVNPFNHPTVREVVHKMIPGTIGVAAFQINMLLTQGMAFFIEGRGEGSIIASFNYAVRLMEFPQGVFGVSLMTYLLSALSGLVASKDYDGFRSTLKDGIHYLSFINIFAAVLTLVLAEPIVQLIYQGGRFTPESTHRTSLALMSLAPSLVAFSYVGTLARGFYALGDVKTPMYISIFCLFVNLVIAAVLIQPLRQVGLGIANSISSWVNFGLLVYAMRLKLKKLDWDQLPMEIGRILLCALVSAQAAWAVSRFGWWAAEPEPGYANRFLAVFIPMGTAGAIYWTLSHFLRIRATRDLVETFLSFRKRK
jgi:putative peptidoglycan lipid II flippase